MEDKFNEGDCLSFECSGMNDNSYLCFREHWELFPDFHSRNSVKSELYYKGFDFIDNHNRCMNCGLAPEHTKHLFYECNLMVNLMRKVEIAIEECGIEVPITLNMMLFHAYGGDISKETRRDIDDLLMIMKHCVYRARFRENVVRYF